LYALIPIETLKRCVSVEILLGESKLSGVEVPKQNATLDIVNLNDEQSFDGIEPVVEESSVSCIDVNAY
jgi:hypothetical protein